MQCPGVAPPPNQIWRGRPSFDRARRHATCDERCAVQDRQLRPATSGTVSARTWCAPCRVQRFHTPIHHRAACLFVCAVRSDSAQSPCSAWFPIVCSHATLSGRQKQRPECSELHEAVPQAPGGQGRACSRGRCVLSKSQDDDRTSDGRCFCTRRDGAVLGSRPAHSSTLGGSRNTLGKRSRVLIEKCRPGGRGRSRRHR